jgi:hypothetical protein
MDQLVEEFIAELSAVVERHVEIRAKELVEETLARVPADAWTRSRAKLNAALAGVGVGAVGAPAARSNEDASPSPSSERQPARRARRRPERPAPAPPPPPDPEQVRRDAELARLRTLLRPPHEEAPVAAVAAPQTAKPADELKAIEEEIMGAAQFLGELGPDRCAAQIAVWAGRARALQQKLPPEAAAHRHAAFRIFFGRLTRLRAEMEAGIVDALNPAWSTVDWDTYVAMNQAALEQKPALVALDKQQLYFRTMLRSLQLPHRRGAWREARAILAAAARVLPETDPDLSAARRRFGRAEASAEPEEEGSSSSEAESDESSEDKPVDGEFTRVWGS